MRKPEKTEYLNGGKTYSVKMLLSMQQSKINLQETRWNWSKESGMGNEDRQQSQHFLWTKDTEIEANYSNNHF